MQLIETPHGHVQKHGHGPVSVVLAHGSGIGMAHDFMQAMAAALVAQNFSVYLFEFAYMQQIQKTGIKRPPPPVARLELEYLHLLQGLKLQGPYIIGGKSLGSRVASLVVERTDALAWLALGYPFHPQKKPDRLRVEHLLTSVKPGLIVQGTRDALGSYDEVLGYALPAHIRLHWLAHMDHSFKPYKASPYSMPQAIEQSAVWIEQWCQNRLKCNPTEVPADEI
ncbi:MAG TPA: hypothetical protein DE045_03025 [Oceanospirillaceae bacterium]|nr:hypothetical protein [Oceanospirillaceae bacterium]